MHEIWLNYQNIHVLKELKVHIAKLPFPLFPLPNFTWWFFKCDLSVPEFSSAVVINERRGENNLPPQTVIMENLLQIVGKTPCGPCTCLSCYNGCWHWKEDTYLGTSQGRMTVMSYLYGCLKEHCLNFGLFQAFWDFDIKTKSWCFSYWQPYEFYIWICCRFEMTITIKFPL